MISCFGRIILFLFLDPGGLPGLRFCGTSPETGAMVLGVAGFLLRGGFLGSGCMIGVVDTIENGVLVCLVDDHLSQYICRTCMRHSGSQLMTDVGRYRSNKVFQYFHRSCDLVVDRLSHFVSRLGPS